MDRLHERACRPRGRRRGRGRQVQQRPAPFRRRDDVPLHIPVPCAEFCGVDGDQSALFARVQRRACTLVLLLALLRQIARDRHGDRPGQDEAGEHAARHGIERAPYRSVERFVGNGEVDRPIARALQGQEYDLDRDALERFALVEPAFGCCDGIVQSRSGRMAHRGLFGDVAGDQGAVMIDDRGDPAFGKTGLLQDRADRGRTHGHRDDEARHPAFQHRDPDDDELLARHGTHGTDAAHHRLTAAQGRVETGPICGWPERVAERLQQVQDLGAIRGVELDGEPQRTNVPQPLGFAVEGGQVSASQRRRKRHRLGNLDLGRHLRLDALPDALDRRARPIEGRRPLLRGRAEAHPGGEEEQGDRGRRKQKVCGLPEGHRSTKQSRPPAGLDERMNVSPQTEAAYWTNPHLEPAASCWPHMWRGSVERRVRPRNDLGTAFA